ncbi:MAG: group II intron maturase-specific domain-containing protein, partial [Verrucomicrobiota bacterium]
LRLKVNLAKSAVDRPWKRLLLGYSMTSHREVKLRVPKESVKRFKAKVREQMRRGRGRNIERWIKEELNPVLRGWVGYYRKSDTHGVFDELDQWTRRRIRNIYWRQWKRSKTRRKKLMQLGVKEERASTSAYNGRGPWWNSGASHLNQALPKKHFDRLGLVSLQSERQWLEKEVLL